MRGNITRWPPVAPGSWRDPAPFQGFAEEPRNCPLRVARRARQHVTLKPNQRAMLFDQRCRPLASFAKTATGQSCIHNGHYGGISLG